MKSKEEIKQWLLENATDEHDRVNLEGLNFGDKTVLLRGITADCIDNGGQAAKKIFNDFQSAYEWILNDKQRSKRIYNDGQEADKWIVNQRQESEEIHNRLQKAERIHNDYQEKGE